MRFQLTLALVLGVTLVAGGAEPTKPYGIERRTLCLTSKVIGSPDPPLPYRAVRVFPKLRLDNPIAVRRQPGTNLLCMLAHKNQREPTQLFRFPDTEDAEKLETLHAFDGIAYDLSFHPRFSENGYLFVGWNGPLKSEGRQKYSRVSRLTMNRRPPFQVVPDSQRVIVEWKSNGHNGAAVTFGNDGMLYVTSGDGTSDSDDDVVGQDLSKLVAKVLRIDVDHVSPADAKAGRAYSIPSDNPFINEPGARPETWAYGLRNPWRIASDPQTGQLWVTQNGQDLYEQVYLLQRGANYGWSVYEGSSPFYLERKHGPTPILPPTAEHHHREARSLTGGVVYRGRRFPELGGAYVYGDYSTGKIWAIRHDGKHVVFSREIADTPLAITGFALDHRGELLICDYRGNGEGGLYRLEPMAKSAVPSKFPRRLSESGLFVAGAGHRLVPGVIGYTVNSPLWSDEAYKERFVALPGATQVDYAATKSWDFPEGTVLIKSFALEMVAGDPASRRWIETRFLTRQQSEWVGYSYRWNDDQTDAELVAAAGADRDFIIRDAARPAGERRQTWHYPSRAECMVCHSRAANFVLGLSTSQLNCDYDYGGVRDNQLRTFAHLGLIKLERASDLRAAAYQALKEQGTAPAEAERRWNAWAQESKQVAQGQAIAIELNTDSLPRLARPEDGSAPLEARARAYLHANCAHCHVPAGGGNAQFDVAYATPLPKTRLLDARPVHATFGLPDARLIAAGHPERSLLWHRMQLRGRGQMPPLASSLVDPLGTDVIRRWIATSHVAD